MKLISFVSLLLFISVTSFAFQTPRDTTPGDNVKINGLIVNKEGVYETVDVEASFPGGQIGWRKFLETNMSALVPIDNGAPDGAYTVLVRFIVNQDGNISDIKSLSNHGYGMEAEVIRVIRLSPKWEPAKANEKIVVAYRTQPMTFVVSGYGNKKPKRKNKKESVDPIPEKEDAVSNQLEEASFPGGEMGWRNFLEKNLNVMVPYEKNAPNGTYKVIVQFTVDTDGSVTDIQQLTIHGYGMEAEIVRLIKSGPKWNPAKQDGKPVKSYRKQPVTFVVSNE